MVLGALRRSLSFTFSPSKASAPLPPSDDDDRAAVMPAPTTPDRKPTRPAAKDEQKLFGMLLLESRKGAVMERFPVLDRQTRIGRAASAQIRIIHQRVSRTHCTIEFDGHQCKPFLHIVGKNGLFLNGVHLLPTTDFEPCVSPGVVPLASGDLIGLENRYFRLECAEGGPMSFAQGAELLDSPAPASRVQDAQPTQTNAALPRRVRLSLISSAVIDTPAKPKQQQRLSLLKAATAGASKGRSFPAQTSSLEQIRAQGRTSIGNARAAPSTPARGNTSPQKRSAPMTEPRNAKLARGGHFGSAQMQMMMEDEEQEAEEGELGVVCEEDEDEDAENLIIVEELDEDEPVEASQPESEMPMPQEEQVQTTMLVPVGTTLEDLQQELNSPTKASPRKQGRRSSLFSLASINLGFYSDSPKQQASPVLQETLSVEPEESSAPSPQPETPTRRKSRSPNKPRAVLIPPSMSPSISAQPMLQPDTREVVDAYGTPRLPRSLSSPSRLNSYRRDFSLRTQALLKGCDEYLEKEALGLNVVSPPRQSSSMMSSLSNVVMNANDARPEPEELTPQDEDDEDEIEKSLSMPEGLSSFAAAEVQEVVEEGAAEEQSEPVEEAAPSRPKPRTSNLPLAFMTPQPRSRFADALGGSSFASAPRPSLPADPSTFGARGPRKSLGKGSRLLALRGGPSPRKTDDWARTFLPKALPKHVVEEQEEKAAVDEVPIESPEEEKGEVEGTEQGSQEELEEMGTMIEDLMDGQGEVDTDEEDENEEVEEPEPEFEAEAGAEQSQLLALEQEVQPEVQLELQEQPHEADLPEAEPMDVDPRPETVEPQHEVVEPSSSVAQVAIDEVPSVEVNIEAGSSLPVDEPEIVEAPSTPAPALAPQPPSTPRYGALRDLISQSPAHQALLSVRKPRNSSGPSPAKTPARRPGTKALKTPARRAPVVEKEKETVVAKTPSRREGRARKSSRPSIAAGNEAPEASSSKAHEEVKPQLAATHSAPVEAAPVEPEVSAPALPAEPAGEPSTPARPTSSKQPSTAARGTTSRSTRKKAPSPAKAAIDAAEEAAAGSTEQPAPSRTPAAKETKGKTPRPTTTRRKKVEEPQPQAEAEDTEPQAESSPSKARSARSRAADKRTTRAKTVEPETEAHVEHEVEAEAEMQTQAQSEAATEVEAEATTTQTRSRRGATRKGKKAEAETDVETEAPTEVDGGGEEEQHEETQTKAKATTRRTRTRAAATTTSASSSSKAKKSTATRGKGKKVEEEQEEVDEEATEAEEKELIAEPKPRRARAAKIKASDAITATIDPAAAAAASSTVETETQAEATSLSPKKKKTTATKTRGAKGKQAVEAEPLEEEKEENPLKESTGSANAADEVELPEGKAKAGGKGRAKATTRPTEEEEDESPKKPQPKARAPAKSRARAPARSKARAAEDEEDEEDSENAPPPPTSDTGYDGGSSSPVKSRGAATRAGAGRTTRSRAAPATRSALGTRR